MKEVFRGSHIIKMPPDRLNKAAGRFLRRQNNGFAEVRSAHRCAAAAARAVVSVVAVMVMIAAYEEDDNKDDDPAAVIAVTKVKSTHSKSSFVI